MVCFIFQLVEEYGCGVKVMMVDGLFECFLVDVIFGVYNMLGMCVGMFVMCVGGIMVSEDNFVIWIDGCGMYVVCLYMGIDLIVIGLQIVFVLQMIVLCNFDLGQQVVILCMEFIIDGLCNVLLLIVMIKGDMCSYLCDVQVLLEMWMCEISEGICCMYGVICMFEYMYEFVLMVNLLEWVDMVVQVVVYVVGVDVVYVDVQLMMILEDFGVFLQVVLGNFVFIGNGEVVGQGGVLLYNVIYDFNDVILLVGVWYFVEVVWWVLKVVQ